MALPQVASSQPTESQVRVHVWRVLSMLAALVALVAGFVVVVTSAA